MRSLLVAALVGVACGSSAAPTSNPHAAAPAVLPGNEAKADLPTIPAKIDVTTSAPTEGDVAAQRSAVLDILKSENEREMGALQRGPDPAYYLAYQVVEQRV